MRIIKTRGRRKRNGQRDVMMWLVDGNAYCLDVQAAADVAVDSFRDELKLAPSEVWPECPIAKAVAA